jgi:hypothetical protein
MRSIASEQYKMATQAHMDKIEALLALWAAKIEVLADKSVKAGAQAGIEYRLSIDALKIKYAVAQARFNEFKAAGDPERANTKASMECAFSDLESAFLELNP